MLLAGCSNEPARYRHELLVGVVDAVQPETGRLVVRGPSPRGGTEEDVSVACLLTNDSELYINDKFSNFDAIRFGDSIEVIGYRRADPPPERLVVSLAYITRHEPPPRAPDLGLAVAAPATQEH